MSFGFEFKNAAGDTIISKSMRRIAFRRKKSITGDQNITNNNERLATVLEEYDVNNRPVVYYVPQDIRNNAGSEDCVFGPSRLYFLDNGAGWIVFLEGVRNGVTYDLYVFNSNSALPASDHGIQIFSDAGNLVFDSGDRSVVVDHLAVLNRPADTIVETGTPKGLITFGEADFTIPAEMAGGTWAINTPIACQRFYKRDYYSGYYQYSRGRAGIIRVNDTTYRCRLQDQSIFTTSINVYSIYTPIWSNVSIPFIDISKYQ
jgi:hypothetical protein